MDLNSDEVIEQFPEVPPVRKKRPFHIDMDMLRYKLHFTLVYGGYGTVKPYLSLLGIVRVGISESAFSAVLSVDCILLIFVRILTAYTADYFNKLKTIINVSIVTMVVGFSLLLVIPGIENYNSNSVRYLCRVEILNFALSSSDCNTKRRTANQTFYEYFRSDAELEHVTCLQNIKDYFTGNISVKFKSKSIIEIVSENKNESTSEFSFCCEYSGSMYIIQCDKQSEITGSEFYTYQFWLFAIFFSIGFMSLSNIKTLSDTACYETAAKVGAKFGKQRLYSTLSYGILTLVGGVLYDSTGDFFANFAVMVVFCAVGIWNLAYTDLSKVTMPKKIWEDVGSIFKSMDFLVFEVGVIINGVSNAMVYYLSPFVASLGGSQLQNGLVGAVHAVICIPFMFFSNWAIKKIGHFNCMSLAMLALAIRFLCHSYIINPWLIVPVELLYGVCYGLFVPTIVSFAKSYSKSGSEATTQSVVFSTYEDIGTALGSLFIGTGSDYYGYSVVFFYIGIAYAVGTVFMLLYTLHRSRRRTSE